MPGVEGLTTFSNDIFSQYAEKHIDCSQPFMGYLDQSLTTFSGRRSEDFLGLAFNMLKPGFFLFVPRFSGRPLEIHT
jgi:hypothetical protein